MSFHYLLNPPRNLEKIVSLYNSQLSIIPYTPYMKNDSLEIHLFNLSIMASCYRSRNDAMSCAHIS